MLNYVYNILISIEFPSRLDVHCLATMKNTMNKTVE